MQHLLEHFKDLTLHPKNAQELKGLILQLGIQGKLTAQWRKENPQVESASVLIEQIKSEKLSMTKLGKINREKPFEKINQDELSYEIPKNWAWTRLGNYTHTFGQKTPNKDFEYIDVASIDNSKGIILSGLKILSAAEAPSRARKIVKRGCVIYSTVRPYLLNIAIVNRDFEHEVIASTAFAVLNPLLGCSPDYLYHLLRSFYFIEYVESCMKGVAYPAINDANLLEALIPIPPLEEQKAIVAIVNQLFAEVELLEAATKKRIQLKEDFVTSALRRLSTEDTSSAWAYLLPHFKTFFTEKSSVKKLRESILQLAVQGKLTRDFRKTHPELCEGTHSAEALLERIKAEKTKLIKEGKIKKEKPLPGITEDEIPYELPKGWVWCRVGDITTIKGGKRVPKGYLLTDDITPYIYIRVTDMKNGSVSFKKLKHISEEVYEMIKQYTISKDDLYITIAGTIGDVGEIPEELDNMNLTENAAKISFYQVDKIFLKTMLRSSLCQSQFLDKINQMAQPKLALHRVASTYISIPPIEEQRVLVQKVNSLMALCDRFEKEIETQKTTQEEWMQSCLREVFEK